MKLPFGFHIEDSNGRNISDSNLRQEDIAAILALLGDDEDDEDDEIR